MSGNSDRLYYISIIRVYAMLCIVFYHSLCFYAGTWGFICADEITPIWRLVAPPIVNIGLTLFVLVSGFLYGYLYNKGFYRNNKRFVLKKAYRLLIPYFVWGIWQIYCVPGLGKGWYSMLYGMSHLWFLLMLFEIFLIIVLLNKFDITGKTNLKVDVCLFVISLIPYFISKYFLNAHSFLCVEVSLKYLPVFIAGIFSNKYCVHEKINSHFSKLGILIGGGILLLISYLDINLNNYLYTMVSLMIGIFLLSVTKSYRNSPIVSYLDDCCMGIYLLNQIVIFYLLLNDRVKDCLSNHVYLGPFIIFTVSFIIPLIITKVIKKYKRLQFLLG